jgi:hypothetical protein
VLWEGKEKVILHKRMAELKQQNYQKKNSKQIARKVHVI